MGQFVEFCMARIQIIKDYLPEKDFDRSSNVNAYCVNQVYRYTATEKTTGQDY